MPKVSICIPAYKDVHGIRRLIESLQKQTYTDYEIIITDDTPDGSISDLIKEYAPDGTLKSNPTICLNYIKNEKPLGPAGNWNKSISLATGEYVKIIHQDDFLTFDDSLESFVRLLDDNPDAVLGFSGSRQVLISSDTPYDISNYYDRDISDEHYSLIQEDYLNLFLGGYIGAPSAIIYRNCDKLFDTELSWLIDGDFYMNLLSDQNSMAHDSRPLISICESKDQLTNSCINNAELVMREHRHLFTKYHLDKYSKYRQKLIQVTLEYKKSYKDIADLGIPKAEYNAEKKIYNNNLKDFYIKLILRKLHLRHE